MDQNPKVTASTEQSIDQNLAVGLKDVLDQKTPLEVKHSFLAWVNCELKNYV